MHNQLDQSQKNYPRPAFVRSNWIDLNGEWRFAFDDNDRGELEKWFVKHDYTENINVPFVFQSPLSGIGTYEVHDIIWYEKSITIPEEYSGKNLFLNFGAVDFFTKVWVNGIYAGQHTGGYSPFSINISNYIRFSGDNIITVRVEDDSYSVEQPRGKQKWTDNTFGCWYTRYTGIWQPVWVDIVDEIHVKSFKITPDIDNRKVCIKTFLSGYKRETRLGIHISFNNQSIVHLLLNVDKSFIEIDVNLENRTFEWNGIALWDCVTPNLYDIEFTVYHEDIPIDLVKSYFGMRKVSIYKDKFLLNNTPFYQKLVLYQGYFSKGHITPENDEEIIRDIKQIKDFGFNGIRIHEKIECPRFLYWCDRMGLLVWEEMPSAYNFSDNCIKLTVNEWQDILDRDYNHPCIVTWVTFNESWGIPNLISDKKQQAYAKALYNLTKTIDQTRPVVANDGWEHTETDICTIHDYVKDGVELNEAYKMIEKVVQGVPARLYPRYTFADGYSYSGQPVIISEFGGISFEEDDGWGYNGKVKNQDEFLERLKSLILAIQRLEYVCGYCLTQFSDVEHEQNGLLTIDRKNKVDPKKIKEIISR